VTSRPLDLARVTFQLLALGVLLASSFWILRPFLVAFTWATTIVVATWPLLKRTQAWLGGRRSLAVAAMTIVLLLVLVVPLYAAITAVVARAPQIRDWSEQLAALAIPPPPAWVERFPGIAARWREFADAGREEMTALVSPYARALALWFVSQMGGLARFLVDLLLTVIIAAILYATGETAAAAAARFARRLAGRQGESALRLAGQAIRAVALGVVVTAIAQAVLGGIGLAVAGVPFAGILTLLMFVLAVAQVGAGPVMIAAVVWVYVKSGAAWGTGFLVWTVFCLTLDNLLRPLLIKRGADLPLLLIFAGVIGGIIAFGVVGLFIGPVVLAVAYTLLADWVARDEPSEEPAR
jgi:predicted PurR-regulated permease PerM